MAFKRIVKTVVLVGPGGSAGPNEYLCGYQAPVIYTLEVGNQPGSQVVDVRAEWEPLTPPPTYIYLPGVDVVDDFHISMACQCPNDSTGERGKVRLIILVWQ